MKNRELLELAAKAAGYEVHIWGTKGEECVARMDVRPTVRWNPLQDDGDALRLAVALNIRFHNNIGIVYAQHEIPGGDDEFNTSATLVEPVLGDYLEATRRAITRAAAAIQQAKEAVQ